MAFAETYRRQVSLLIRTLPHVASEACFALKGGTAINLFVRNMPRLSVDIDLTYVPVEARSQSLATIDAAMKRIAGRTRASIAGAQVTIGEIENTITKLFVRADGAQIKIEVTPVLRGCVFEPELRTAAPAVEVMFGFAEIPVVSFADLYAGKIVAALDRQHPRDLFDIRDLLALEGIDDDLRCAFIVYLLSHDRPMFEVLAPRRKDFAEEYLRGFEGMTDSPVSQDELRATREELVATIVSQMPDGHRRFLISFERGVPNAAALPAILWRQQNLDKLSEEKRAALVGRLSEILGE